MHAIDLPMQLVQCADERFSFFLGIQGLFLSGRAVKRTLSVQMCIRRLAGSYALICGGLRRVWYLDRGGQCVHCATELLHVALSWELHSH